MLPNNHSSLDANIRRERLRQASVSFNVALGATAGSAVVILVGMVLLLVGRVSEGSLVTIGGLSSKLVCVRCLQLAKESNDRLK